MASATFRINREILSRFLPDHDSIRQFENLFNLANTVSETITNPPNAGEVEVDTSDFDGHLSSSDTTVQKALDTLDELKDFKGYVTIAEYLTVGEYIEALGYIKSSQYIEALEYIKAGKYIEATEYVKADEYIEAGQYVKAAEHVEAGTFFQVGIQNVNSADTVSKGTVFCSGSDYTLTMPAVVAGRKVEVFNTSESGSITVSSVAGEDFKLYSKESLDMTCDGSDWYT